MLAGRMLKSSSPPTRSMNVKEAPKNSMTPRDGFLCAGVRHKVAVGGGGCDKLRCLVSDGNQVRRERNATRDVSEAEALRRLSDLIGTSVAWLTKHANQKKTEKSFSSGIFETI